MDTSNWDKGWQLITHSVTVFQKYPLFIVPILTVWCIYAPTVLYLKYGFPWHDFDTAQTLALVFVVIFLFSFAIVLACDTLLEMIKQMEDGEPSLRVALSRTFSKDLTNVLTLAIAWAVIWFALTVIEALVSGRRKDEDNDLEFNARNAAETIADFGHFSLSRAFFEALQKGIRMVVFLILPAIAWENMSFIDATKKGLAVLRAHLAVFASGYALTYAAAAIAFLPPALLFFFGTSHHGQPPLFRVPDFLWVCCIIYIGLAWSFCLYLEQMSMAELYLWHQKWERKYEVARLSKRPLPLFKDIEPPVLLVKVPNLFSQASG
jgi:hypothetical protein